MRTAQCFGVVSLALALVFAADVPRATGAGTDPTFAAAVGAARGSLPAGIVHGAFGGPGTKLLATAESSGSTLRILDGALAEVLSVPGPVNPADIAAGDFDDDGYTDLVFVVGSQAEVWINAGTAGAPVFPGVTHTLDGGAGVDFARVATGDLNDGDPADVSGSFDHFDDVVAIGTFDDGFSVTPKAYVVLVNHDAGFDGFELPVAYTCNQANGACAIGDVTDDGKADVVACDTVGRQVVAMLGDGTGVLNLDFGGTPQSFGTTHHLNSIAIGDVTADGKNDVVSGGYETFLGTEGELSVHVLRWTGATLSSASGFQVATQPVIAEISSAVAIADFNGDGKREIAVANPIADAVSVLLFTAIDDGVNPFFLRKDAQFEFPAGTDPFALVAGDVGGDAKPDIATANGAALSVNVLVNTSAGGGSGEEENLDLHPVLPAATQLNFISKKPYQDGKPWKFNAAQPDVTPGIAVRVQSTSTPAVESSWTDLPGGAYMNRIGPGSWTIKKVTSITAESGTRILSFRTITSAPGYTDGISAPTAPESVAPAGPLLKVEVEPITLISDTGHAVAPGGTITYIVRTLNLGTEVARAVTVSARIPKSTVFLQASHFGTVESKDVVWDAGDIDPDAFTARVFAVTVPAATKPGTVIAAKKFRATFGDRGPTSTAETMNTQVRDELIVGMTATPELPRPGDRVTFLVRIKNGGAADIADVALLHQIVEPGIAYEKAVFVDVGGNEIVPPRQNPAPSLDRDGRRVTIRLDSVLPAEELFVKIEVRVQYDRDLDGGVAALLYRSAAPKKGELPVAGAGGFLSSAPQTASPQLTFLKRADADGQVVIGQAQPDGEVEPVEVATLVMPPNAANAAAGRITYTIDLANDGNATAPEVRLTDAIPSKTTLVAGSMKLDGVTVTPDFAGSPNVFRLALGALDAGDQRQLVYTVQVAASVKPGAFVSAAGGPQSLSYLSTPVVRGLFYQSQPRVDVLAVEPVTFDVRVGSDKDRPVNGDDVTYPITFRNDGGIAATGVRLVVPIPEGMEFRSGTIQGRAAGDGVTSEFNVVGFAIGTMAAGQELSAELVLRVTLTPAMAQRPYSEIPVKPVVTATNQAAKSDAKAGVKASDLIVDVERVVVAQSQRGAALFLGRVAPLSVTKGASFKYVLFYGNLGDFPATGARIAMQVPFGTKLVKSSGNAAFKSGVVTWTLGTVAPHSAGSVEMVVQVDANFRECSIDDHSSFIELNETPSIVPPRISIDARSENALFNIWESIGCCLKGAGRGLAEARKTSFGDDAKSLTSRSRFFTIGGADVLMLRNGCFVIPLGGGNIVAGGGGNIVAGGGGNLIGQDGAAIVAAGGGNIVSIKNLGAGLGTKSGSDLLANIANGSGIVAGGGGNIVAGGGGNLIGHDGATVVSNDGAGLIGDGGGTFTSIAFSTLILQGHASIVAGGGGNIVAAGGGNIVAGGGGNIFSPNRLIGHDGATIVAGGGGNLTGVSNGR